jgi:hypothetical protein
VNVFTLIQDDPHDLVERSLKEYADGLDAAYRIEQPGKGPIDVPEGTVVVELSSTLCAEMAHAMRDAHYELKTAPSTYIIFGGGIGAVIGVAVMLLIEVAT